MPKKREDEVVLFNRTHESFDTNKWTKWKWQYLSSSSNSPRTNLSLTSANIFSPMTFITCLADKRKQTRSNNLTKGKITIREILDLINNITNYHSSVSSFQTTALMVPPLVMTTVELSHAIACEVWQVCSEFESKVFLFCKEKRPFDALTKVSVSITQTFGLSDVFMITVIARN